MAKRWHEGGRGGKLPPFDVYPFPVLYETGERGGCTPSTVDKSARMWYNKENRKNNADCVRHQLLTNPRVCGIIKKIGKIPPKVYVINC